MNTGLFTGTVKNSGLRYLDGDKAVCNLWLEVAPMNEQQSPFILPVAAWDDLAQTFAQIGEGEIITVEGYVEIEEVERNGIRTEIVTMTAVRLAPFSSLSLIGRAGSDPEVKEIEQKDGNYTKVAKLRLAVDRGKKEPSWFNVEAWGRTAEIIEQYVRKGSQIGVTGSLRTDTWKDRTTGAERSKPILRIQRLELLGSKPQSPSEPEPALIEKPVEKPSGKGKRTRSAA